MSKLWLVALLVSPSAFALCPPGESKIGYTFCVRYTVLDVKSQPAWITRFLFGKQTYNHRRVLRVRVEEVRIPQEELQPKDAPLRLMPGSVVKLGVADTDHGLYQTREQLQGLVEEECHDKGEADYEFTMTPKLVAKAVGPSGVGRNNEIDIDCTPPSSAPAAKPAEPEAVSDAKTP